MRDEWVDVTEHFEIVHGEIPIGGMPKKYVALRDKRERYYNSWYYYNGDGFALPENIMLSSDSNIFVVKEKVKEEVKEEAKRKFQLGDPVFYRGDSVSKIKDGVSLIVGLDSCIALLWNSRLENPTGSYKRLIDEEKYGWVPMSETWSAFLSALEHAD